MLWHPDSISKLGEKNHNSSYSPSPRKCLRTNQFLVRYTFEAQCTHERESNICKTNLFINKLNIFFQYIQNYRSNENKPISLTKSAKQTEVTMMRLIVLYNSRITILVDENCDQPTTPPTTC